MPTFGFSAYLKLISLNEKPQRSNIRERFRKRDNGYDFHRSLRLRIQRMLVAGEHPDAVIASVSDILRTPEQKSARLGLERLIEWRKEKAGEIVEFPPALYESPGGVFKVNFNPEFGIKIGSSIVAVHTWNTAFPNLKPRIVYAALSLFPEIYQASDGAPDDLAVLSLRDGQFYRLSESFGHAALGLRLVEQVEEIFHSVRKELGLPSDRRERPSPPSPPV
jgi:hypothetical protein